MYILQCMAYSYMQYSHNVNLYSTVWKTFLRQVESAKLVYCTRLLELKLQQNGANSTPQCSQLPGMQPAHWRDD